MKIGEVFLRDPTRSLEEVQKVDSTADRAQAEEDIREFTETESSRRVLSALIELLEANPGQTSPRFLYLHATFGSGKSHLLKLIGLATGEVPNCADLASSLAERFSSFRDLRDAIAKADADHLVPIFLNLLDRDPAAEPPLPSLVYHALCRRLGYPTDPPWLAEWAWEVDRDGEIWAELQKTRAQGRTFSDVVRERAPLRSWLKEVVPALSGAAELGQDTADGVDRSIERAVSSVDSIQFDGERLAEKVREAKGILSRRLGGPVDLLLGLDEVALFVGDSERRFSEFEATIHALDGADEPIVVGTGQWSLAEMARGFYGDAPPAWMRESEVPLEAADSELIVRNRWLRKKEECRDDIRDAMAPLPDELLQDERGGDPDARVESYPFLPGDLKLFRNAAEEVLTAGATTDREYIQGRALLVYVRALFTELGWDDRPLGQIVPWDVLFDLLKSETTYIPGWVDELLEFVRASTADNREIAVRCAKAVYLLNHAPPLVTSASLVARHLLSDVQEEFEELEGRVKGTLEALEDMHLIHGEQVEGVTTYRLLSRDEVTVSQKIREQHVSQAQVRSYLERWLQEHDLPLSDNLRREVDLEAERQVPLRTRYSLLSHHLAGTSSAFDAVTARFLVHWEDVDDSIARWKEVNREKGPDGEDLLIVMRIGEAFHTRLNRLIAMQQVLQRETRRLKDLESLARQEEQELRDRFLGLLDHSELHVPSRAEPFGEFGQDVEELISERIVGDKFPDRRVLQQPLRPLDDARDLAKFFRAEGTWPFTRDDARTLGVDLSERRIEDDGWIEEFFARYDDGALKRGEELLT